MEIEFAKNQFKETVGRQQGMRGARRVTLAQFFHFAVQKGDVGMVQMVAEAVRRSKGAEEGGGGLQGPAGHQEQERRYLLALCRHQRVGDVLEAVASLIDGLDSDVQVVSKLLSLRANVNCENALKDTVASCLHASPPLDYLHLSYPPIIPRSPPSVPPPRSLPPLPESDSLATASAYCRYGGGRFHRPSSGEMRRGRGGERDSPPRS
eukprot:764923-Hanusia_phi.AAC.15